MIGSGLQEAGGAVLLISERGAEDGRSGKGDEL
jgi:hypothetical protein